MGNYLVGRRDPRIEEIDNGPGSQAYLYPPKAGNYFSSHFIMGGERFDTCQPEMYLFGENLDLNFLGGKPTPFPYTAPLPHEPTRTLRSLVNIRKESLRFVKIIKEVPEDSLAETPGDHLSSSKEKMSESNSTRQSSVSSQLSGQQRTSMTNSTQTPLVTTNTTTLESSTTQQLQQPPQPQLPPSLPPKQNLQYNIEFTFDSDVKVAITIHYFCNEEISSSGIVYSSRDPSINSETFHYKRGPNQQFQQPTHICEPYLHDEDDLMYRAFDEQGNFDTRVPFPVVIQCKALEGDEPRQSHSLIAVVERNQDGSFSLKPFKQKIFIDGLCYLLQEMYGIENKSAAVHRTSDQYIDDSEIDDNGSECVICMSDSRDTLILPCRHLCLCNACADSLRYQANNCPICRSPFRALLQMKAVRKHSAIIPINTAAAATPPAVPVHHHNQMLSGSSTDLVDIPPGYEPYPLLEALNGPNAPIIASHGMFSFRPEAPPVADGTPGTGRRNHNRRDKREHRPTERDSSTTSLTPSSRRKQPPVASPSTPEVVVSTRPLSPEKSSGGDPLSVTKETEKWPVPNARKRHAPVASAPPLNDSVDVLPGHESSASSTSSNGFAIPERARLLPDPDESPLPVARPRSRKHNNVDVEAPPERPTSYMSKGKSPRKATMRSVSHEMCSPSTDSPMSSTAGVAGPGSFAMMSLRDGFDEQRCMADTDFMSMATSSVGNVAFLGSSKDQDDDEEFETELFNDDVAEINASRDNVERRLSLELQNKLTTVAKLAEIEPTDDLDMSPVED